jgi:hypothetical protein
MRGKLRAWPAGPGRWRRRFGAEPTGFVADADAKPVTLTAQSIAQADFVLLPRTCAIPPDVSPTISGTLGNDGWYTSEVTVSWSLVDNGYPILSSSGCSTTVMVEDTSRPAENSQAALRLGKPWESPLPDWLNSGKSGGVPSVGSRRYLEGKHRLGAKWRTARDSAIRETQIER